MSLFSTKLPLDLKPLLESLPKDCYIHSITFDRPFTPTAQKDTPSCVVIEWESAKLKTGYTFPVDYPLEDLQRCRLPSCVKKLIKAIVGGSGGKNIPTVNVAPKNAIPDPQLRTQEAFQQAQAEGKALEYQGVEALWLPVTGGHEWTEGYFYRVVPNHVFNGPTSELSGPSTLEKVPVDAS